MTSTHPPSGPQVGLSARPAAWASARPAATTPWRIWRAFIAIAYLAAAGFNAIYTLPRTGELDGYADGAWFGFLGNFTRDGFTPNGKVFMMLVIIFEVVVAILIASRKTVVDAGVALSVRCVLAVLPFLRMAVPDHRHRARSRARKRRNPPLRHDRMVRLVSDAACWHDQTPVRVSEGRLQP